MTGSVECKIISVTLASLGFSFCNSALFAHFFFSNQGFALDTTSISDDGYFLPFPTLAFFSSSLGLIFFTFNLLTLALIFMLCSFKHKDQSILALIMIPTALFAILVYSSSSILSLDPDFMITEGIAAGSVSPVLTYRFAAMICLILLALTVFVIVISNLVSYIFKKVKS